jgi:hypothetical protein
LTLSDALNKVDSAVHNLEIQAFLGSQNLHFLFEERLEGCKQELEIVLGKLKKRTTDTAISSFNCLS